MGTTEEAISEICWYNGHTADLLKLVKELKKWNNSEIFIWEDRWKDEELHFIWMILVYKFGDWGSSINGGWINGKECKAAAQFLFDMLGDQIKYDSIYLDKQKRKINIFKGE